VKAQKEKELITHLQYENTKVLHELKSTLEQDLMQQWKAFKDEHLRLTEEKNEQLLKDELQRREKELKKNMLGVLEN